MSKFAVGDIAILTDVNARAERQVPVVRVGRKYVYVCFGGLERAFDFDGRETGNYSHYHIYTPAEWAEKTRRTKVIARLRADHGVSFDWQHSNRLSTATIERVLDVLNEGRGAL